MHIGNLSLPRFLLYLLWPVFIPVALWAQTPVSQNRVVEKVNESALVTLRGNTHPLAQAQFDQGAAPPDLPMSRMLLVLKRSDAQESALRTLLDAQQDLNSPSYHQWLTPDQFGQQFGPSDQDMQAVAGWLISHGFQIGGISRGRTVIEFSGSASQVRQAFHAEIHKYAVNGEDHWANASDPQIPAALANVVEGVATLHNFSKKPQIEITEDRIAAYVGPGQTPQVTFQNGRHALGPWDYDTIYNILPIINPPSGFSGPPAGFGTIIAVVGRSNIDIQDVARFRAIFNLQNNNPQIFINGPDPGNLGGAEEAEAVLDTTWSGAIAPGANVWLIVSASTNTTDGVDLSEVYVIDGGVGTAVMTESFGTCEAGVTAAEATNISQLAEQAAAEGITYVVSAGDTGSAGCDHRTETQATGPFSVNVLASSPFTLAVGGTQFNENGNDALYWNISNDQSFKSVRSYIPEDVWNQSCMGSQCGQLKPNIIAGGGGSSMFFGKPSWQSGVKGIPNDGMRDVPDVALTAAGHDPYLICLRGSCQPDAQGNFFFAGAAGTSAAAPSFAGIAALMNSLLVPLNSHPRLGQINYVLYRLAANQNWSSCNGSNTSGLPANSCIFNDVTEGNNSVPGEAGYGTGTAKYQSGVGYDLASGLGSVNVANLANHWNDVTVNPTATTFSLSPTSFTHGTPVNLNIHVTSANGTPTGDVSLFQGGIGGVPTSPVPGNFFTLNSSSSVSASTNLLPGGYYSLNAHYAGDGNFMASDSGPIALTVSPEPSSTVAETLTLDQNGKFVSFTGGPYGSFVYVRADVTGQSGIGYPTGTVNFTDNGVNLPGSPYTLNSEGNAATLLALFTFAVGQHSVMADYNSDPSFSASTSLATTFSIAQASTSTAVTSSAAVQGADLTATVSTNSGGAPPSGTVTFFIGGIQVGSPVPVSGIPAVTNSRRVVQQGAQATASFTDSQLANGQFSLSATYSGDNNYSGSSAPPTMINVQADYSLTASANSITIASPGGMGSLTLIVTGGDGFTGTVGFSCSGLPSMSSCQFNPGSVSGSGSAVMNILTTAPTALIMPGGPSNAMNRRVAGGGMTVAGIFLLSGLFWRRRAMTRVFAVFALLASAAGCGRSGNGPVQPPPNPGTLPGSYTVTVTGTSGALTHSTTFVFNVQ